MKIIFKKSQFNAYLVGVGAELATDQVKKSLHYQN